MKRLLCIPILILLLASCNTSRETSHTHFEVSSVDRTAFDTAAIASSWQTMAEMAANLHVTQTGDWWFRVYDTSQGDSTTLLAEGGGSFNTQKDATGSKKESVDVNTDIGFGSHYNEIRNDSLADNSSKTTRIDPPPNRLPRSSKAIILFIIAIALDGILTQFAFSKSLISWLWKIIKISFRKLR